MDSTVRSHIARIQREIEALSTQLMNAKSRDSANAAEANIRSLKVALAHYELALKIESEVLSHKANAASAVPGQNK
jgi:hypothetical protein